MSSEDRYPPLDRPPSAQLIERLKDFELGCAAEQLGVAQGLIEHRLRVTIACELDVMGRSPRHAFDLIMRTGQLKVADQAIVGSVQEHFKVLEASPVESDDDELAAMFYVLAVELSYELLILAQTRRQAIDMARELVCLPEHAEAVELMLEPLGVA